MLEVDLSLFAILTTTVCTVLYSRYILILARWIQEGDILYIIISETKYDIS